MSYFETLETFPLISRKKLGHSLSLLCNISLEYLTAGGGKTGGREAGERQEKR